MIALAEINDVADAEFIKTSVDLSVAKNAEHNLHKQGCYIMKAIIPVAGLGTRMLPATKAIPKEMLPVVDKPLIQWVVEEIAAAGVKEIVLVTHSSKNSIENHFDTSFELEATLESRVKRQLLKEIQSICPADVRIITVRQGAPRGLGHAILCAYPVVGDEDVMIVLPDVLISPYACDINRDNLSAMRKRFITSGKSQILVEGVPANKTDQYGIVELSDEKSLDIAGLAEKPEPELAKSNLAIVGRYILSRSIWSALKKTKLGVSGEIQLTDAIEAILKSGEPIEAHHIVGRSYDCGSKIGFMIANVDFTLQDKSLQSDFYSHLVKVVNKE